MTFFRESTLPLITGLGLYRIKKSREQTGAGLSSRETPPKLTAICVFLSLSLIREKCNFSLFNFFFFFHVGDFQNGSGTRVGVILKGSEKKVGVVSRICIFTKVRDWDG